ncbi:MAG: hypothetical protein J6Y60_05845, partial [Treponema sp.]|nr:hypothetical protein [Treponema sp.]
MVEFVEDGEELPPDPDPLPEPDEPPDPDPPPDEPDPPLPEDPGGVVLLVAPDPFAGGVVGTLAGGVVVVGVV